MTLLDQAIADMGRTKNPLESGYILPDGTFLKMGEHGDRGIDHRFVEGYAARYFEKKYEFRSDAMYDWMLVTHCIRWMPETEAIEMVTEPTPEQVDTIDRLARKYPGMTLELTLFLRGQWRSTLVEDARRGEVSEQLSKYHPNRKRRR